MSIFDWFGKKQPQPVLPPEDNGVRTIRYSKYHKSFEHSEQIQKAMDQMQIAVDLLRAEGFSCIRMESCGGEKDLGHTGFKPFEQVYDSYEQCREKLLPDMADEQEHLYLGGAVLNFGSLDGTFQRGKVTLMVRCWTNEVTVICKALAGPEMDRITQKLKTALEGKN